MQGEDAKQRLQMSVMSENDVIASELRWQADCARLAAIKAGMWMRQEDEPGISTSADAPPSAAKGAHDASWLEASFAFAESITVASAMHAALVMLIAAMPIALHDYHLSMRA